jgi:hypothetical protein
VRKVLAGVLSVGHRRRFLAMISIALHVAVALMWAIPDPRIERILMSSEEAPE